MGTQQNLFFTGKEAGAVFSDCRKYRYVLWRIWDDSLPLVAFIGLNPSTANEVKDDATIRRVKTMAKWRGFGGVFMLNCFPYISTDPKALDDFGNTATNDHYINITAAKCSEIIFAWGAFKQAHFRGQELAAFFPDALALKVNKDGSPAHPLYIPTHTIPVKFRNNK